jgi:hypothetical protein
LQDYPFAALITNKSPVAVLVAVLLFVALLDATSQSTAFCL